MQDFYNIDFNKIYPHPTPERIAEAFFNRLWRKLHYLNFSLLITFYGPHRCLTGGNKILMADGSWKNIEDIKIGDIVLSPQRDSSVIPSKVLNTTNYFCKNVYNVVEAKRENKLLYSCSDNHNIPIFAYCSKRTHPLDLTPRFKYRTLKEVTAENISRLKKANHSRIITFTTPPINFKQKDADVDPYCLGLWLGDGCCSITTRKYSESFIKKNPDKKNTLAKGYTFPSCFSITTNNSEIICEFKQRYDEITSIGSKQKTTAVTLRISTKGQFFKQLKNLNLIGTKAGTKFIPKECLFSSINFRFQLLAGLIDTDGYISNHSNNIEITTKSKILALNILDLVHSLGGNGNVCKIHKSIKKLNFKGTYYTARFAFNKKLSTKLIKYVKIQRKKERILKHINIAINTNRNHKNYDPCNISIKCIPAKPQMVYGFTIDSRSHWFITNNWIVTCNSGKSLTATDFAYILDPTFENDLENRIVYSGKELVTAFKKIRKEKIRGAGIIVDEAGSGELSSSRWYEEAAKIINAELQAVGYLNPFVGFVTQSFSFINTTARRLSQGVFRVNRTRNEYATIKPFWISDNPFSSGIYHKYPLFCERHANGINKVVSNIFKINRIKIGITPSHIRQRYERHSQAYKDKLLNQSEEDMETLELSKTQKNIFVTEIDAIVKEVLKNKEDYMLVNNKNDISIVNDGLIRHRHELSWKDAKLVKALVDQKLNKDKS